MSDTNITIEKKPNLLVRILVIAGMLLILFFIAAAIVKYVPKIISAISPANVSLTSMFNGGASDTATTTTENTNTPNSSSAPTQPAVTVTATSTTPAPAARPTATTYTYTAPRPAPTYVQTYRTYSGPADLAISLVQVGQISSNGAFIQTNSIQPGSRVQVKFNVSNVGASASGSWNLNAVLPTSISSEKIYNSSLQPSIPAGASYQMTLAFDAYDGNTNIQITLNASNDANTSNNILIVPLTSNGNNNGNNNCYWSNGTQYCNNNGNNNGSASDLSVIITNVGTMDRNTGQFYFSNSNNFNRNDKLAVQFTVTNIGGTNSNSWNFNANLPSSSNSNYSSNTQNSLAPGQTTSFTLGFDNPYTGSNNFSIQLNPQGSDNNSSNNYASRTIYVNN